MDAAGGACAKAGGLTWADASGVRLGGVREGGSEGGAGGGVGLEMEYEMAGGRYFGPAGRDWAVLVHGPAEKRKDVLLRNALLHPRAARHSAQPDAASDTLADADQVLDRGGGGGRGDTRFIITTP